MAKGPTYGQGSKVVAVIKYITLQFKKESVAITVQSHRQPVDSKHFHNKVVYRDPITESC